MKRHIEKLDKCVMRFFTPELYMAFNSTSDEEADRADDAWEAAIKAYRRHLVALGDRMPSQVRKLAEMCLHDAEVLACDQEVGSSNSLPVKKNSWTPSRLDVAILSLRNDGRILSLVYSLWDRIREKSRQKKWTFSKQRKHWLYDEIDLAPDNGGKFLHRVLFSDGTVIEIPFLSVVMHSFPMPDGNGEKRPIRRNGKGIVPKA